MQSSKYNKTLSVYCIRVCKSWYKVTIILDLELEPLVALNIIRPDIILWETRILLTIFLLLSSAVFNMLLVFINIGRVSFLLLLQTHTYLYRHSLNVKISFDGFGPFGSTRSHVAVAWSRLSSSNLILSR